MENLVKHYECFLGYLFSGIVITVAGTLAFGGGYALVEILSIIVEEVMP